MALRAEGVKEDVSNLDHYRQHTISKGVAVAMLVITVVAAALAIYFGHQAWQAGVNFSGNIPNLMGSIPFDATFLIGCTAAVIGIAATVYSIYQYVQSKKSPSLKEDEIEKHEDLDGSQAEKIMNNQSYAQLVHAVERKLNASQEPTDVELKQLTDNYQLMLNILPTVPEIVIKCVVTDLYANGQAREFKEAVNRAIDDSNGYDTDALSALLHTLREVETERLMTNISQRLTKLKMADNLKMQLLPGVKSFIWDLAVTTSTLDDDKFRTEAHNKLDHLLKDSGLKSSESNIVKNQLYSAIKSMRDQFLFAAVGEIEEYKGKLK